MNSSSPPGLSTRRISCSAPAGSGMLQSVQVITALSKLASGNGRRSAGWHTSSAQTSLLHAFAGHGEQLRRRIHAVQAIDVARVIGHVQPRADADFEHPAFGAGHERGAALAQHLLLHREIDEARQYEAVVEAQRCGSGIAAAGSHTAALSSPMVRAAPARYSVLIHAQASASMAFWKRARRAKDQPSGESGSGT